MRQAVTTRAPGEADRRRKAIVNITLTHEARDWLDELARQWGTSRSGAVERLVREAARPRRQT